MYKEPITEDRLRPLTSHFRTIEIIPVKNDKPIFILKDLPENSWTRIAFINRQIIMHDGKFIWENDDMPIVAAAAQVFMTKDKYHLDRYKTCSDYLNQFTNLCPGKEFSIQSILDIATIKSDKKYIKPIRDFLRKYKILKDRRGSGKKERKYKTLIEERVEFVYKTYKDIMKGKKRKSPIPIKSIQIKLEKYRRERSYSDDSGEAEREKRIFDVKDVTIRRDILKRRKK